MTTLRVAVYGDLDLNLLDGSSIWLASLVETLTRGESIHVTILPKRKLVRGLLTDHLERLESVRFIGENELSRAKGRQLSPQQVAEILERHDRQESVDVLLIRGRRSAVEIASRSSFKGRLWTYMTDMPQAETELTEPVVSEVQQVIAGSRYLLCQTEDLRSFLETHFPKARWKTLLLPPMIPDDLTPNRRTDRRLQRLVYAGKFSPPWGTCELLDVFNRLRAENPEIQLHVFGDKIHDPPGAPGFKSRVKSTLENTEGLYWHRAVPRSELSRRLPTMDFAWSWRRAEVNSSLELSTKVLEYGAAGLPVVLNRSPLYERLLGNDYPLFATTADAVLSVIRQAAEAPEILEEAATATRQASRAHTFSRVYQDYLRQPLESVKRRVRARAATVQEKRRLPKVLVAGHDLRFLGLVTERLEELGAPVSTDRWSSHSAHDEARSRSLLVEADVVFCEWCLGNAVWYARNKRDDQRLVVRLHLQERDTAWPGRLDVERTEGVVFISEAIRNEVIERFSWPRDKTVFVPNYVDISQFRRPKLEGAQYNLGMIGVCPSRKRLDRALDILEAVRAAEPRFSLYIKSRMPWDYDWLWRKEKERAYYEIILQRIRQSPLLKRSVVFDTPGSDVPLWLRKIGFLLSVSDFEGSHQAAAEGAASGALPVILPWAGAEALYPGFVHTGRGAAAREILGLVESRHLGELQRSASELIEERYRPELVIDRLLDVMLGQGPDRRSWAI